MGRSRKTPFSPSKAKAALGSDPVTNTVEGMADAFVVILQDQGFEVNYEQIKVWCRHQFNRKYKLISPSFIPKTVGPDTLIKSFRTYMENWYSTHRKWQLADWDSNITYVPGRLPAISKSAVETVKTAIDKRTIKELEDEVLIEPYDVWEREVYRLANLSGCNLKLGEKFLRNRYKEGLTAQETWNRLNCDR